MMEQTRDKQRRNALNRTIIRIFLLTVLILLPFYAICQEEEILTAEAYFETISTQYGQIEDYQADVIITQEESTMKGELFYKPPNMLRINFSDPEDQVLVIDGKALTIYIPKHEVIMHQQLKSDSSAGVASMASEKGLKLLRNNYSIAYKVGPEPVPLEEGSDEMVIKLQLDWRSTEAGFRELEVSIGENGLIRRIIGVTVDYEEIQFDFENILINQNIPEARFEYESPPTANIFDNFLFEPDY
jgi:outer membrane lipoprotein-sorting protein